MDFNVCALWDEGEKVIDAYAVIPPNFINSLIDLAEEFVERLLSKEAHDRPSDSVKVEDLEMKLPEWFDENKFNQGRRFHDDFHFSLSGSMMLGLLAVLAIPSILNVLIASRRSSSSYTAYKRYLSTLMHTNSWFKYELKPGTRSWQSLYTVRSRHILAGRAATLKGVGIVSQRDLALTLFGFIGFSVLKPDKLSIRQLKAGDWDGYNHCWKVIGHMIGLDDRYNICRNTYEETRQVCQIIQDRVFTPCLENVPEYYEHMARVLLEGLHIILASVETSSMIFMTKYMADVPGYICTEQERMEFSKILKNHQVNGKFPNTGVTSNALIQKCAVEGLPDRSTRMFYFEDFASLDNVPAYKELPLKGKYNLACNHIMLALYGTYIGRIVINYYFNCVLFMATYLPFLAMWKFGIKNAFVNMFKEDPIDNTVPKPNSEYSKRSAYEPWYKEIFTIIW